MTEILSWPLDEVMESVILDRARAWAKANCPAPIDWNGPLVAHPRWDGHTFRFKYCQNDYTRIVHEVNHYFVAAKRRRRLPDFGLGDDPDGAWTKRTLRDFTCDLEELAVSLLDVQVLLSLDLDEDECSEWFWEVVREPRTIKHCLKQLDQAIRYLTRRKIMVEPNTVSWAHEMIRDKADADTYEEELELQTAESSPKA